MKSQLSMKNPGKVRTIVLTALLGAAGICFAAANGTWLAKVPQADRARVNPYAGSAEAAAAGANLYRNNCAKCHGENAEGRSGRPALKSDRIQNASDGDLAWIIRNGEMFKGMPSWGGLPEQERWQLVTYIRSLNMPTGTTTPQSGGGR
jgi:mono/diheme cytochrome c family protein